MNFFLYCFFKNSRYHFFVLPDLMSGVILSCIQIGQHAAASVILTFRYVSSPSIMNNHGLLWGRAMGTFSSTLH